MSLLRLSLLASPLLALLLANDAVAQAAPAPADPTTQIGLVSGAPPEYPDAAYLVCAHGRTKVRVSVDKYGKTLKTRLEESSGDEDLDAAALKAVRSWQFHGALVDGQLQGGEVIVPVNFEDPCPAELMVTDPHAKAIPPAGWDAKASPQGWDPYELVAGRSANPLKPGKGGQCATAPVQLRVTVSANGYVREIAVATSSGNPAFDAAAIAAAKYWSYRPGRHGERVVGGDIDIAVDPPASCRR